MHPGPAMFCPIGQTAPVLLLMHFDANTSGWIEEVGRTVTVVNGPPTVDTTTFRFGPGSIKNSDTIANLKMPPTANLLLGTNTWTVDLWVLGFPSSAHVNTVVMLTRDGVSLFPLWQLQLQDSGTSWGVTVQLSSDTSAGYDLTMSAAVTRDSTPHWRHVRFGRCNATDYAVAYEGTIIATGSLLAPLSFNPNTSTGNVFVFGSPAGSGDFSYVGNLDEFCIRQRAMDTSNFTPPTQPFRYP